MSDYILSLSYGKDSLKMLDVVVSRGLPLNRIITFDVWATDTISADIPEVAEFKNKMDVYILNKYGYEVEHLCAKDSEGNKITYEKVFYKKYETGKNKGRIYGFPFLKRAWCNGRLKLAAKLGSVSASDIEYIGIAYDEINRHKILNKTKLAPLVYYRIDEDLCGLFCYYSGILSPSYEHGYRDGCWFCHNQSVNQLRNLRNKHPDLWQLLLKWDNDSPVSFAPNGITVHDYEIRFQLEDLKCLPIDKSFRWKMLHQDLQISLF